MTDYVLEVSDLTVEGTNSNVAIIENIDLQVRPGELVGLVGESGSGKSTLGLACLGFTKAGTKVRSGSVRAAGVVLEQAGRRELRSLRRHTFGYVPQSAGFALDPSRTVGSLLHERLSALETYNKRAERNARILEIFDEVGLPNDIGIIGRYPHQFSGGQQQRIVIANAFLTNPKVVILDEPTTGLDVSTQVKILDLVRRLCESHSAAAIFVSHDLGSVSELCNRAVVLYAGRVVEDNQAETLLAHAQHPYTAGLIRSVPDLAGRHSIRGIRGYAPTPAMRTIGCQYAARCEIATELCRETEPALLTDPRGGQTRCHYPGQVATDRALSPRLEVVEPQRQPPVLEVVDLSAKYGDNPVLHDVSLNVPAGSCVGLVGESGSGKTTLCRSLIGLHEDYSGSVVFQAEALPSVSRHRSAQQRREIQYVFQNPYDSLNPRRSVAQLLDQPRRALGNGQRSEARSTKELLNAVRLSADYARKYPAQLSGGELQRVAIARALAASPRLLICDEITSALDVSVQAAIVELLAELQREMNLALLFVTHNLALTRHIADAVVVLKNGHVVESGATGDVFENPSSEYTASLLADAPDLWRKVGEWKNAATT